GILLGEAMQCKVEQNICVGNRVGIEVRQQRIRTLPGKTYYSDGHTFDKNIAAFNTEWQFALYGDNPFFGPRQGNPQKAPPPAWANLTPEEMELYNPGKRGWHAGHNVYFAAPGAGLVLWGAKWLPKHQEYKDLKTFAADHGLDGTSIIADPQ